MNDLKYVVTGTGHSGTRYTSRLLSRLGSTCGHEDVFTFSGLSPSRGLSGDSSWMAVYYLDLIKSKVVHLVRSPLKTIRSLGCGFFDGASHRQPYMERYAEIVPDWMRDDIGQTAMRRYSEMNRIIGNHPESERFRLEDLSSPSNVADLCRFVGAEEDRIEDSLKWADPSLGRHVPAGYDDLEWDHLIDCAEKDSCLLLEQEYGYA